jgi:glycosyltransferase involved in cell wall biosynthesis
MAVYNGERYLEEAVDSILGQTFTDFELVVVDDGSTDSTLEILERLSSGDGRVRVISRDHRGMVPTFVEASGHARGAFIARMDADDVALPQRLERQLEVFESRPELGALGTWLHYIQPDGRARGEWRTPVGSALVAWSLNFGTALANPTVTLRRELYESVGGDREEYAYASDYDLWIRLAEKTLLDNIPEHLLLRRVHPESDTIRNPDAYEIQTRQLALASIEERFDVENAAQGLEAARSLITSPASADERVLREAARFTERLFDQYRGVVPLTHAEEDAIRADAARRLAEIAKLAQSRRRALAWRLLLRSLLLRWRRLG